MVLANRSAAILRNASNSLSLMFARTFFFFEPKDEEPPTALVGRDECPSATAFTTASQSNPFFDNATSKICIDESADHCLYRLVQDLVGQFCLPRPPAKMVCFVHSPHEKTLPLSVIVFLEVSDTLYIYQYNLRGS